MVLAAGFVLGHLARWFADGLAVNLQLYFHAFRVSYVHSNWVIAPMRFLSSGVLQYSALVCWAIGWGYVIARGARTPRRHALAFALGVVAGVTLTATSVRVTQPQFFAGWWWAAMNPAIAGAVCAIAAVLVSRTPRSAPAPRYVAVPFAIGALVLSWWGVNDVSHAMSYGCVPGAGLADRVCPSPEWQWGVLALCLLAGPIIYMLWDSMGRPGFERQVPED